MTPHNELRLLPWSGPDGKPCFLSTDDNRGHLSRLADNHEGLQLGRAAELLGHAPEVLGDDATSPAELRLLAEKLTRALGRVRNVDRSLLRSWCDVMN
ncbi:hypothetical protein AB0C77_31530 [Streptomyces sp. NPDC048629]|uniref:hypothetical protein n=1 Tax=Streptomyces sp. NPDC048629 TaxID=3154824 RepID=UPI003415325B